MLEQVGILTGLAMLLIGITNGIWLALLIMAGIIGVGIVVDIISQLLEGRKKRTRFKNW